MMTLPGTGIIVRIFCIFAVLQLFMCSRDSWAIPVLSSGSTEITFDTLDSGGNPVPGYNNGTTSIIYSLGEPGGITRLSGGIYELLAGYYGQDLLPPGAIANFLCSLNAQRGTVELQWTSPGDDLSQGQLLSGSRVYIASTTVADQAANEGYWYGRRNDDATEIKIATHTVNPGAPCAVQLTGLVEGVTYYFRVWTLDQAANWSEISNGTSVYFLFAPGSITDLSAITGRYGRSVQLSWTAPGKDGYSGALLPGSRYAIQRSTWTAVSYSTSSIDTVYISTQSVNPGDQQYCNLRSLTPGVTYYVRMWTADENPVWSDISNSSAAWANSVLLSVTLPTTYYHFGEIATNSSTTTATAINVVNSGNVPEDYLLSCQNSLNWTVNTAPAKNIFALQAGFHAARPVSGAFNTYHYVALSNTLCSNTSYTIDGSQRGISVDPFISQTRNLWFKFSTPLATSTSVQQNIIFTITAQESD